MPSESISMIVFALPGTFATRDGKSDANADVAEIVRMPTNKMKTALTKGEISFVHECENLKVDSDAAIGMRDHTVVQSPRSEVRRQSYATPPQCNAPDN